MPPDRFYFSPEINIYDNKVMIAPWREKLGVIIESAEIADAMKKSTNSRGRSETTRQNLAHETHPGVFYGVSLKTARTHFQEKE